MYKDTTQDAWCLYFTDTFCESVKKGSKSGCFFAALNHTTGQAFYHKATLNDMFRRPVWMLLLAVVACMVLGGTFSILYAGIFVLPVLWGSRSYQSSQ